MFDYYCEPPDACPDGGHGCSPWPDGRLCALSEAERFNLEEEVETATTAAMLELDCQLSSRILRLVEDPASERITVELAIDQGPFGVFNQLR